MQIPISQSDSPRRQILLLLATLIPLLFALRWLAAKFPTSTVDCGTYSGYVEPGKMAYFVECYYARHKYDNVRVFVIDFDKVSMNEIMCPTNAEPGWMVNALTTYAILVSIVVLLGSILTHRICPPFSPSNSACHQLRKNEYKLSLRQLLFITFVPKRPSYSKQPAP